MATIPQPKGYPLIGNIAELDPKAPVQSLMRLAREHGPLFRIEKLGTSGFQLCSYCVLPERITVDSRNPGSIDIFSNFVL